MEARESNEQNVPDLEFEQRLPSDVFAQNFKQKSDDRNKPNIFIIEKPELANLHNPSELASLVQSHIFQNTDQQSSETDTEDQNVKSDDYDENILRQQVAGSFGSKVNGKNVHIIFREKEQDSIRKNFSPKRNKPSKLIESTSKLISGQDVLSINEAIKKNSGSTNPLDSIPKETILVSSFSTAPVTSTTEVSYSTQASEEDSNTYNLSEQPIVVDEVHGGTSVSTIQDENEAIYSSTQNSIEKVGNHENVEAEDSTTLVVTPRPVSSNFLAPITAGIRLQHIKHPAEIKAGTKKQTYDVEILKTLPYYVGKYEYVENLSNKTEALNDTKTIVENFELGAALLSFPVPPIINVPEAQKTTQPYKFIQQLPSESIQQKFSENYHNQNLNNDISLQQLPSLNINEKFAADDQLAAPGKQVQVPLQQILENIKLVHKQVPAPESYSVMQTKVLEKPVQYNTFVNNPYTVQIPQQVPYPFNNQVPAPLSIPYPVQKLVPLPVTQYVDRPYPVHIAVPQPYPVEVRVPVQVPIKVPQPAPVQKTVERKVPVPVTQYVNKPYPVEVKVPMTVPHPVYIQVPVEVPRPYTYVQQQYPSQQYYNVPAKQQVQQPVQLQYHQSNQYAYQSNDQKSVDSQQVYVKYPNTKDNLRSYLPPQGSTNSQCDQEISHSYQNPKFVYNSNSYVGLVPPKIPSFRQLHHNQQQYRQQQPYQHQQQQNLGYRNPRSNFDKNLRIEYGFLPPLIPSLEIDENGNPIEREKQT